MTKVKWINHSSLLIEDGKNIILTDPWFEKPKKILNYVKEK